MAHSASLLPLRMIPILIIPIPISAIFTTTAALVVSNHASGNFTASLLPLPDHPLRRPLPHHLHHRTIWLWALGASLDRLVQSATMSPSGSSSASARLLPLPLPSSSSSIGMASSLFQNGSSSASSPAASIITSPVHFAHFLLTNATSGEYHPHHPNHVHHHHHHHHHEHVHDEQIHWRHPLLALLFLCFCCMTIFGNCLVVLAVFTKRYLRNPTGYLIVSLAVADLIVGVVVMPLNSLFEMSHHVWLLGLTTCDIWHALDILASTSSIWNLCVISLDRYMAGVDPIGYRDRVSKRRIIYCIFFVWMVSACISFPAIYWWRRSSPHLYQDPHRCTFTDDAYYVVFSGLISFYIPTVLILFAYGRVYCIATTHSRSLKSGEKRILLKRRDRSSARSAKSGSPTAAQTPRNYSAGSETLRIHFGQKRTKTTTQHDDAQHVQSLMPGDESTELRRRMLNGLAETARKMSTNSLSLHTISTHQQQQQQHNAHNMRLHNNNHCNNVHNNAQPGSARDTPPVIKSTRTSSFSMHDAKKFIMGGARSGSPQHHAPGEQSPCNTPSWKKKSPAAVALTAQNTPKTSLVSWSTAGGGGPPSPDAGGGGRQMTPASGCCQQNGRAATSAMELMMIANGQETPVGGGGGRGVVAQGSRGKRMGTGMREKSRQMIKHLNEQRAARTLSIVVGVFILCWTPFFLFTPLMVLCGGEKSFSNYETIFSVITWAGHLNSMLNPLIYSRFSRDFRKAFKQILTCERERPTKKAIKSPLNIVLAQLTSMAQIPPPTKLGESSEGAGS